jgi:hypothetical protein
MDNNISFFIGGKQYIIDENNITKHYTNEISTQSNQNTNNSFANMNNIINYKNNKYNLDKRIMYYNYIHKKLSTISNNKCLEKKKFDNVNYGYTIDGKINLIKIIGTKSSYGVIYITKIKNVIGKYPVVSKLLTSNKDNLKEIKINTSVTKKIVLNKFSKHFLLTYKVINCKKKKNNLPEKINNNKYYIILNELAHGDIKQLFAIKKIVDNNSLVYNIFIQVILSILTFHNIGYIHRDCHYGNFLYQRVNDDGYYHYKIYNKDYYLKSCDYNILIYDFGLSKKHNYTRKDNVKLFKDYYRIHHAFLNKSFFSNPNKVWNEKQQISFEVSLYVKKFISLIYNLNEKNDYIDIINKHILPYFIINNSDIFLNKKPLNSKIINKTPFIIKPQKI